VVRPTPDVVFSEVFRAAYPDIFAFIRRRVDPALVENLAAEVFTIAYDLWDAATGLLRESPDRPELRRGLWEVIATIPGVTLDGPTTDATGRDGTAVSVDFRSQNLGRYVLVLDPSDGRLLETRYLDNDGALLHTGTVVEQGPRDSAPKPQPPVCGPGSEPERSC